MRKLRNTIFGICFLFVFGPASGHAASLLITWDANTESDIAGYKVYYGTGSGIYGAPIDVGNVTSYQLENPAAGTTYYVVLTAYDTSGNESAFSTEESLTVPAPDTTIPTGTMSINSGSATAPSRVVTLTFSAADASGTVVGMMIGNSLEAMSAEAQYQATQTWALTEGDGVKTVYVKFKDAAGNWSEPVSATIRLSQDTDGDGLPDAWESSNGLDPVNPTDAALDSDLDGFSNLEEYYNGTNPGVNADGLPVVRAGADQQVTPTRVYLDGSASTDPHHLTLQYSWSFVSGPVSVSIENATIARASFVGTRAGVYRFMLTCSNGKSQASDMADITILNAAPTVDAGGDLAVDVQKQVTLHATGSDPNGDALIYKWKLASGPAAISDRSGQDTTLTLTSPGQYKFSVTCSDGQLASAADEAIVLVNSVNHAPTAEAGNIPDVQPGQQVLLNGSGSTDPDGNTLTYSWKFVSGPVQVTLQNAQTASASFTPGTTGSYVFELTVSDGLVSSLPDTVNVTVLKLNTAPVADAGNDQNALVGDAVALDATGSYDPDGSTPTFTWTQSSGATVALSGAKSARPIFTPTASGVLGFTVSVSDGQITAKDTVQVTVDDLNQVPVAEAGPDKTVQAGSAVTLDGAQSSDADGDAISYVWSQASGPVVSLNAPNTAAPSFTPTQAGTYTFSLKVYDGKDTSTPDTVSVMVQQTAVTISLLTPQMGSIVSTNPVFTWNGTGIARYRVYVTVGNKKYSNIYSGTGTSCKMNSSLWNWFLASGTTVYWYVEGTAASNGQTCKSPVSYFKKR
jgi:hypothetical protein